jgi:hypothetical protein
VHPVPWGVVIRPEGDVPDHAGSRWPNPPRGRLAHSSAEIDVVAGPAGLLGGSVHVAIPRSN